MRRKCCFSRMAFRLVLKNMVAKWAFEMRAWAKCGPGGLNLELFLFAVLRGSCSEKAHKFSPKEGLH